MGDEGCSRQDFGPHDLHPLVLLPWLCATPMALHGKSGGRLSGCEQSNRMHPLNAENFVRLVAEREVRLEHKGHLLLVLKMKEVPSWGTQADVRSWEWALADSKQGNGTLVWQRQGIEFYQQSKMNLKADSFPESPCKTLAQPTPNFSLVRSRTQNTV